MIPHSSALRFGFIRGSVSSSDSLRDKVAECSKAGNSEVEPEIEVEVEAMLPNGGETMG